MLGRAMVVVDLPLLLSFMLAAILLTITPGIDTVMMLRATTVGGVGGGIRAGVGIMLGLLLWGAMVSVGLGALLQTSAIAYDCVKWAGAGYLCALGIKQLMSPRQSLSGATTGADGAAQDLPPGGFLRKGFLTNILNPKVGVFYITFLPQFIPHGAAVGPYSFFLTLVHCALTAVWFVVLVMATLPLGRFLKTPRVVRLMDRVTGGVFIAFGAKLAASSSTR
ncbi:MAG: LysE family translocator [Acetobacter orientalis]|uniref:LysE family translocator n=1 Tax=Acetobacter orientalis TaxID=146474 RepID=UPI0039E82FF9